MTSVWKGSLSFGLVNIPVRLYPAIRSGEGQIHFRQLHAADLAPIRYERVCTADGETVDWADIVKGYEYAKGKYVALSSAELESAALESSKAIEMLDFVKEEEIDPRFFDTPYYLVPEKGAERAYAVLRQAIDVSGRVGIGKFTLRQKEQLASVKAMGGALVLEVMRFASQLVDPGEFSFPAALRIRPDEARMAEQLIDNLARPFDPDRYKDDYQANLMRVIRAKLKGKKIPASKPAAAGDGKVIDLVSRLRQSVDQTKRATGRRRHAPARGATRTSRSRRTA
jgi:DNA end-binding protein Ku